MAKVMAVIYNCPIVLGAATPSVGMVLAYSSQAVVRASAVNGVSSTVCTVDVFSSATDSAGF